MTHTNQSMPGLNGYRTSIDKLRFSDEAKERMAVYLADAATEQGQAPARVTKATARRHRLPLAAAAAGLALALCLGGVAYATGSLVSVQRLVNHLFGGEEAKVEVIDKIGRPVGVAQSSNGVTVSADAIIGDKTSVAVVFSVSKDDGTPFEGVDALDDGPLPLGFSEELDIDIPLISKITEGLGSTGSSYFYDADPADNAVQLVETRSYEGGGRDFSLIGHTLTAHFSDLKHYGEGEPSVIAAGDWTLSFPLDYEDVSVTLPTGQAFELAGFYEDDAADIRKQAGNISATVEELTLSPISLHLSYTADQKVEWTSGESGRQSTHDSQLSDTLLTVPASIAMADGSTIELASHGGGAIFSEGDVARCETTIFFDRILNLDEVVSITIGGTTIKL